MRLHLKSGFAHLQARLDRSSVDCAEDLDQSISVRVPEVISVDFFDTLAYRLTARPEDVFLLQHQLLPPSTTLTPEAWLSLRKSIEHKLSCSALGGEIQLIDIYVALSKHTGWSDVDRDRAMAAELLVELDVIKPYASIIDILRQHHAAGRQIVITTDTYLPEHFMARLLRRMLDFPCDLLCSSATDATKRSGAAFRLLRRRYPRKRILHVGDNVISDYHMARRNGVGAVLIDWPRSAFLRRNAGWVHVAATLGLWKFTTPVDKICLSLESHSRSVEAAQREVAWRWAIIQAAMMADIRQVARDFGAEKIWFLSRDCESLHAAASSQSPDWFGCPIQYVHTSRAATHPIMALHSEQEYLDWTRKAATDVIRSVGRGLCSAYRELAGPDLKRLLIVDTGWKGRIQRALDLAMPEVEIKGYYVSLDELAEVSSVTHARQLIEWDRRWIRQAAAEALAGFEQHSCSGYRQAIGGQWEPVFKPSSRDMAPQAYVSELRSQLAGHLAALPPEATPGRAAVRNVFDSLFAFPDQIVARAFADWGIGVEIGKDAESSLVKGGSANFIVRVFGVERGGNYWAELAFWSLSSHPWMVRTLQRLTRLRRNLQRRTRRLAP